MKKHIYLIVVWLLLIMSYITEAQVLGNEANKIGDGSILEKLRKIEHSDWREKDRVLKNILSRKLILSQPEKNTLIEIFDQESKFEEEYVGTLRKQGVPVNDAFDKFYREYRRKGYADYFIKFANLIYSFKDVRAIPGLLRALHYYGGEIVPTHVIGIGGEAAEALLGFLNSEDRTLRNESYRVLSGWVNAPVNAEDYTITKDMAIKDKRTLDQIKVAFLKALNDKDLDVRSAAVYGLAAFPEETVVKSLEEVAKNDPYSFYSKYEKKMKYPIREEAIKAIEKIKNKMKKMP